MSDDRVFAYAFRWTNSIGPSELLCYYITPDVNDCGCPAFNNDDDRGPNFADQLIKRLGAPVRVLVKPIFEKKIISYETFSERCLP